MEEVVKRFLVVEDSSVASGLLVGLLRVLYATDADILVSTCPEDALHRLDREDFDLLILDLNFDCSPPECTIEAFAGHMQNMPCIVISAFCDEATIKLAEDNGADCCIPKGELSLNMLRIATRLAFCEHQLAKMAKVAGLCQKVV